MNNKVKITTSSGLEFYSTDREIIQWALSSFEASRNNPIFTSRIGFPRTLFAIGKETNPYHISAKFVGDRLFGCRPPRNISLCHPDIEPSFDELKVLNAWSDYKENGGSDIRDWNIQIHARTFALAIEGEIGLLNSDETDVEPCRKQYRGSGMFSIGLDNIKNPHNLGSAIRAVGCFGGNMVIHSGSRLKPGSSHVGFDKHVPTIHTPDVLSCIPRNHVPVAVELHKDAQSLVDYVHPRNAYYIFGAEDNTLGKRVLDRCRDTIYIPSALCLNLAACVNVVLYDRIAKECKGEMER